MNIYIMKWWKLITCYVMLIIEPYYIPFLQLLCDLYICGSQTWYGRIFHWMFIQWSESWHGDETGQNFDRDQGDWHVPSYHRRRSPKPNAHPSNYHTNQYQGNDQRRGCDFCSEPNHSKDRCRHGQPITCQTCGEKGHKSKHHYQH